MYGTKTTKLQLMAEFAWICMVFLLIPSLSVHSLSCLQPPKTVKKTGPQVDTGQHQLVSWCNTYGLMRVRALFNHFTSTSVHHHCTFLASDPLHESDSAFLLTARRVMKGACPVGWKGLLGHRELFTVQRAPGRFWACCPSTNSWILSVWRSMILDILIQFSKSEVKWVLISHDSLLLFCWWRSISICCVHVDISVCLLLHWNNQ